VKRLARRALLALAGLALADQAAQWTVLADGRLAGAHVAPHAPPLFTEEQVEEIALLRRDPTLAAPPGSSASLFDAELGWAPRPGSRGRRASYDEHGARRSLVPLADGPRPGLRRVVALGCSFTHGDEVGEGESWAALLSDEREDLEVANLGFGGYGLDQALLRWRRDGRPLAADEVWLGWMPGASLRVTTHLPLLANHWTRHVLFKPRFVLAGGELALRPSPTPDRASLLALYDDPARLLAALGPDDPWIARARGCYLPRGDVWWHRSALARIAMTARERGARDPSAWLAREESGLSALLVALVEATAREARLAGARFRLLLLPSRHDLAGPPYWEPTLTALRALGLEVIDLAPDLAAQGIANQPDAWMPGGHYAPRAHRLVADAIARRLGD